MAQQYREGDWFGVPIAHHQFALGLIARQPKRGGLLLGYFFGPPRKALPDPGAVPDAKASDAVLVCRFKEAPLHRGLWRVVGSLGDWRHQDWPMPPFLRKEGLSGRAIRVEYEQDNLTTPAQELPAGATDSALPEDIVYDEQRLTETLNRLFAAPRTVTPDPGQWKG